MNKHSKILSLVSLTFYLFNIISTESKASNVIYIDDLRFEPLLGITLQEQVIHAHSVSLHCTSYAPLENEIEYDGSPENSVQNYSMDPFFEVSKALENKQDLSCLSFSNIVFDTLKAERLAKIITTQKIIKQLNLNECNFLTEQPFITTLKSCQHLITLNFLGSVISDENFQHLGQSLTNFGVLTLNLGNTQMSNKRLEFLCDNLTPNSITSLSLSNNNIISKGLERFGKSRAWPNLSFLSLAGNPISDIGIKKLNNILLSLTSLDASNCKLTNVGITALIRGLKGSTKLVSLSIESNNIDASGFEIISATTTLSNLIHLNIQHNNGGDEGMKHLSNSSTLTQLQVLNVGNNKIGPKGFQSFAQRKLLINHLTYLHLGNNNGGDEGIIAFSQGQTLPKLDFLCLISNQISENGGIGLLKSANFPQLTYLDIRYNHFGFETQSLLTGKYCKPIQTRM